MITEALLVALILEILYFQVRTERRLTRIEAQVQTIRKICPLFSKRRRYEEKEE